MSAADDDRVRLAPTSAQYMRLVDILRTQHAAPDWSSPELLTYRLTAANIGVLMAALAVATASALRRGSAREQREQSEREREQRAAEPPIVVGDDIHARVHQAELRVATLNENQGAFETRLRELEALTAKLFSQVGP